MLIHPASRRIVLPVTLLLSAVGSLASARPDEIAGTTGGTVSADVPNPDKPNETVKVTADVYARSGNDKVNMTTVAGVDLWDKLATGYELHFINVVVKDPAPPSWIDEKNVKHDIQIGEMYVDPLSGGNVPPGKDKPNPPADRKPPYDGERSDKKASTTGDFDSGEKKEYDLNDASAFGSDPDRDGGDRQLEKVYADAPTMSVGLQFTTFVVLIKDKKIYRLGGFDWGYIKKGDKPEQYINTMFEGTGTISKEDLNKALKRSGFGDYNVEIPAPGSAVIAAAGLAAGAFRRRRA